MSDFSLPRVNHAHRSAGDIFRSSHGPIDPAGRCIDLSDRPLFCASSNLRNEVVIGGSDHALYAIDVSDPRKRPVTMYTKTSGHTDWVTTVAHLPSGQVLSGAMDGKLCLWSAHHRQSCVEIDRESTHPISKVVTDLRYDTAVACSYDGNIEIYSFSGQEASSAVVRRHVSNGTSRSLNAGPNSSSGPRIAPKSILQGHTQPVLEASYHQNILATGDKGGALMLWDMTEGRALHRFRAHPGAVTNIHCCESGNVVITAAVDGFVKIWDPRSSGSGLAHKIPAHVQVANPQPVMTRPSRVAPGGRVSAHSAVSVGNSSSGRGNGGRGTSSSSAPPAAANGAPVGVMAVTYARGSNSDFNYIITGGGSPTDSRLSVIDARMLTDGNACGEVPQVLTHYDHHRNGIYSLCVVGDDVVLSGDGVGTLLCHHLIEDDIDNHRAALKYGLGASAAGAVRAIHCIGDKVVAAGEDGKAMVYEYA